MISLLQTTPAKRYTESVAIFAVLFIAALARVYVPLVRLSFFFFGPSLCACVFLEFFLFLVCSAEELCRPRHVRQA